MSEYVNRAHQNFWDGAEAGIRGKSEDNPKTVEKYLQIMYLC